MRRAGFSPKYRASPCATPGTTRSTPPTVAPSTPRHNERKTEPPSTRPPGLFALRNSPSDGTRNRKIFAVSRPSRRRNARKPSHPPSRLSPVNPAGLSPAVPRRQIDAGSLPLRSCACGHVKKTLAFCRSKERHSAASTREPNTPTRAPANRPRRWPRQQRLRLSTPTTPPTRQTRQRSTRSRRAHELMRILGSAVHQPVTRASTPIQYADINHHACPPHRSTYHHPGDVSAPDDRRPR